MRMDDLWNIIVSSLFVSKNALSVEEICKIINNGYVKDKRMRRISKESIPGMINSINIFFDNLNIPFEIKELPNGKYDLLLKKSYFRYVEKVSPYKELSNAVLRTLALIAYKSPMKQKDVVALRGHGALEHIKELSKRGFVKIEKVKNYNVIRITRKFLDYFGLKNEKELKEFFEKHNIKENK